jgi:hypothetical protein
MWDEPSTLRELGGTRVRTFRIGARGIVGQKPAVDAAQPPDTGVGNDEGPAPSREPRW